MQRSLYFLLNWRVLAFSGDAQMPTSQRSAHFTVFCVRLSKWRGRLAASPVELISRCPSFYNCSPQPISPPTASKLRQELLVKELNQRLREGGGETLWELDPTSDWDGDGPASSGDGVLADISAAAAALSATATLIRPAGPRGAVGHVLVRRVVCDDGDGPVDVRVAVVGNVDSGKRARAPARPNICCACVQRV